MGRHWTAIAIDYALKLLAGGIHFLALGTPLGLVLFLAFLGIADGAPLQHFGFLREEGWTIAIWAALWFGGIPAFATGLVAAALRLRLMSHALFSVLTAMVGTVTTAAYLALIGFPEREPRTSALIIAVGALASLCCAASIGFWLPRTKEK